MSDAAETLVIAGTEPGTPTKTGAPAAPVPVSGGGAAPSSPPGDPAGATTPAPTLGEGGGKADEGAKAEAKPEATWPDDWRQRLAGEDKAYLKTLERYDSPAALAKAHRELRSKIDSGQVRSPLPKDATPDQVAAYRAENGIPENPDGYEIKPSNGYVFGEADKPLLDSFKSHAHGANLPPDVVNTVADWYAGEQERMIAAQHDADDSYKAEAEDTLRSEWGSDYRRNLTGIQNFLAASAPDGLADQLLGGRTADGRKIGNDPAFLQFLSRLARETNPAASVVPAGTPNAPKAVKDEIAQIEQVMATDPDKYWSDKTMQGRFSELLAAQARMG